MAVWIVLLEADAASQPVVDDNVVGRLLSALSDRAVGLHCPDRCAVQLEVNAGDQADALAIALRRWYGAVARLELHGWELVRTEVLTRDELAREMETHDGTATGAGRAAHECDPEHSTDEAFADDLLHRLFSDPVTGLTTPEVFWSRLEKVLAREGEANAVVCVEVDGLEGVDSRFGGTAREQVLVSVAQRLSQAVRADDFVGHLGSDAFGVLIQNTSERTAAAIAERVVHDARAAVSVCGQEVVPTVSAGVVLTRPGDTPDAVMGYADMVLSAAQSSGGTGIELFRPGGRWPTSERLDPRVAQAHDRLGSLLLLQEATVAANEASTVEEAAKVVLRQVCAHAGWVVGRLTLAADTPGGRPPRSVWHVPALDRYDALRAATQDAVPPLLSVAGEVLRSGRFGHVADMTVAPEPAAEVLVDAGLRGALAAPVLVDREVVAVLEFFTDEPMEPEPSLVDVITAVGIQLGRVVERVRAREVLHGSGRSSPKSAPAKKMVRARRANGVHVNQGPDERRTRRSPR